VDVVKTKAKQGNLEVVIEGVGQLKSDKRSLPTALTKGTVKEIALKPGAKVISGSVIVRLENPELVHKVLLRFIRIKGNHSRPTDIVYYRSPVKNPTKMCTNIQLIH
jgi:multidrug efflux pump subunit AcrA (membrane-fusion protein)